MDRFDHLNGAQLQAVTYGEGPVLVVAGPGSGKTLTLACRVAYLVSQGVPPGRILLLTFTRRAAREMLGRARRMVGHDSTTANVWGGTFHATANRLLRLHGRSVGLQPDFTIMDQADAADLMNLVRGDLGLGRGERRFPRKETLSAIYSRTVNAGKQLDDVLERSFPWCRDEVDGIRTIFQRYTVRKLARNVLDYDDLLLYWNALSQPSGAHPPLASHFDHVLVDEYQDTNAIQADILQGLCPQGASLMVVGDDAQAIYSFRSATNRNILEFADRFPGAGLIKLERNYRSTTTILEASNAVIALSPERHEKTMWSERSSVERPILTTCLDESEQSDLVCRHLLEHRERGIPLRRQAVLFRAAHHSDLLEVELARRNIPFVKYGGLKFLEAAHVKDVLAFLRILENPDDEVSWYRILQLLDGVGQVTARRVMADLGVGRDGGSVSPTPLATLIDGARLAGPARAPWADRVVDLVAAVADCLEPGLPPAGQVDRAGRFLEPVFVRLYESPRERMRDVEQLANLATGFATRGNFISGLTLDPPNSTGDLAGPPLLDEDYVVLSTIHSAKGLEWDVVHLIHAADGMIPSDMATGGAEEVEEERRLLYVAMTRARDVLYVYFPLRYYHRPRGVTDAHSYAQLTRFLPEGVRSLFDERVEATVEANRSVEAAAGGRGSQPALVSEYLGSLWGP